MCVNTKQTLNGCFAANIHPRKNKKAARLQAAFGAPGRIRTDYLLITNELLYRVSYRSVQKSYHNSDDLSRWEVDPLALPRFLQRAYVSDAPVDYEKSRKMILRESVTANAIGSIAGGSILAGFNKYLGLSNEMAGIIAAIPLLTGVLQMFSALFFERLARRKFFICLFFFLHRLSLSAMYFVPLMVQGTGLRVALMFAIYVFASSFSSMGTGPVNIWMIDLVPESLRGRFFAKKDAVSLIANVAAGLVMGVVLDAFRAGGREREGFLLVSGVILLLLAVNTYLFAKWDEPLQTPPKTPFRLRDMFQKPLAHKEFRKVIGFNILYCISLQMAAPFFSVYMVDVLGLSYLNIMLVGFLSAGTRVIFLRIWGRMADSASSWPRVAKWALRALGLGHALWFFASPNIAWFYFPILQLFSGMAWGGVNLSIFNLPFAVMPKEGRNLFLAMHSVIGSVTGFLAALLGAGLSSLLGGVSFSFWGLHVGNTQILFLLSGVCLALVAEYPKRFIKVQNGGS